MKIAPAGYHRNSKNWHTLVGKTGTVLLATQLEVTSPELETYLPYSFLLVQLESGQKIEVMGEAHTFFKSADVVRLELRKTAVASDSSIVCYGIKAVMDI